MKFLESKFAQDRQINLFTSTTITDYLNHLINKENCIDILILDIEMPQNGFEIAKAISFLHPEQKIVFFTSNFELLSSCYAFSLDNIYGCFSKTILINDLKSKLIKINQGSKILDLNQKPKIHIDFDDQEFCFDILPEVELVTFLSEETVIEPELIVTEAEEMVLEAEEIVIEPEDVTILEPKLFALQPEPDDQKIKPWFAFIIGLVASQILPTILLLYLIFKDFIT